MRRCYLGLLLRSGGRIQRSRPVAGSAIIGIYKTTDMENLLLKVV